MNQSDDTNTGQSADPGTTSLEGQFLIAMPHLQDPYFNGSLTYLWKHSSEGSLGIVINQPSSVSLLELLQELDIEADEQRKESLGELSVLTGGPVERNKGFILHESGREWDYTVPLDEDLSLTMSRDILADIAAGNGPQRYLVALGCASWEAGQLDEEMGNNVWLNVPADSELALSTDYEGKAEAAAARLGVELSQLSSVAGHS